MESEVSKGLDVVAFSALVFLSGPSHNHLKMFPAKSLVDEIRLQSQCTRKVEENLVKEKN